MSAWVASNTCHQKDPTSKAKIEASTIEAQSLIYAVEGVDESKPLLDRKRVIELVRFIELDKIQLHSRLNFAVAQGRLDGAQIPFVAELERI